MNDDKGPTQSGETLAELAEEVSTPTAYDKLKSIRSRKNLEARQSPYLRETFVGLDGKERPLRLRYYQVQGILHLLAMNRFVLGDDCGLGKCKPKSSLVLTKGGLQTLGSMGPPEPVPEDTFHPLREPTDVWTGWTWAPVKKFYYCGVRPTRTLVTRRGYEVTGSLVHPLWSRGPWGESFLPTGQAYIGDYLCLDRSSVEFPTTEPELPSVQDQDFTANTKKYKTPICLTPDLSSLLGYIVAEGCTRGKYGFDITQHKSLNGEVHDHIRSLCDSVFGWAGNDGCQARDISIGVSSLYLRAYLEGLGIGYGLSATKSVPWPIFKGTKDSVASFLRALFDGEGSVTGGVLEISSASEQMLREVQILLLRFGVLCTRAPKRVKGYEHTYWKLAICGDDLRRFSKGIGFLTPRKQNALEKLDSKVSNPNLDVVPYTLPLVEALRAEIYQRAGLHGYKGKGIATRWGSGFYTALGGMRNGKRNPTFQFLQRMLDVAKEVGADTTDSFKSIQKIVSTHFFYDPIVSIHEGEEEVVDIEVDDPRHSFVADGFVNHNTLQTIGALCYLWEKNEELKVVILTNKSAVGQWVSEFDKFSLGVKSFMCMGSPVQRRKARKAFRDCSGPSVIVMGYASAKQDFSELQDWNGYVLVLDEATAFKNHKTQTHQVCKYLSSQAARTWGLTATLIKNHLVEGWGIYGVIVPGLFGNEANFMNEYCIIRMMPIPGSRRQIPTIVGYRPKDVIAFRDKIDPYYLGRPKFEVASELPPLITRHVKVDLTPFQEEKYAEALSGILQVGTAGTGEGSEEKEVTKLTAVTYCQQIVNHPGLIGCDGDSSKLDELIDLVTSGEFEDEKVIIFTRFRKMVDIIMPALKAAKVGAVRITGEEDEKGRKASQDAFQDPSSKARVVCITTAAAEAINLQAAKVLVFYDSPWSAGDYLQLLGRMIRIGSIHDRCYAVHLSARGTIDERVAQVLTKKMGLVESVLGKRIKGEDSEVVVDVDNDLNDLFAALQADARAKHR